MQWLLPAWRDGFYRARVMSTEQINANTLKITLSTENNWPVHQAGQHLALTVDVRGKLTTRVFTIASGARRHNTDNEIRLVLRVKENGALTPYLRSLKTNQWVNISAPKGSFQFPQGKPVLMVAGGSGITPFIAMLEDYLALQDTTASPASDIHLLYYAKRDEHLLLDELSKIASAVSNFSFRVLTRERDGDVSQHLPLFKSYQWMVCGPQSLYESVSQYASSQHITVESEHFAALSPIISNSASKQTLSLHHDNTVLNVNNQQTLLEQLQQANIPVNFGCGMGICHQCQCVKKQGVVRDIRTGELSDNAEELIQLCVSQAVTNLELQS